MKKKTNGELLIRIDERVKNIQKEQEVMHKKISEIVSSMNEIRDGVSMNKETIHVQKEAFDNHLKDHEQSFKRMGFLFASLFSIITIITSIILKVLV